MSATFGSPSMRNRNLLDNGFIVSRHLDDKAGVAIMLAAIKALEDHGARMPVDVHWLFTIARRFGVGAASVLMPEVASMVTIDTAPRRPARTPPNSVPPSAMADQAGPFDYHLTRKLVELCREQEIPYQKDIFRYYRSEFGVPPSRPATTCEPRSLPSASTPRMAY